MEKQKKSTGQIVSLAISILLLAVMAPILVFNLIVIFKGIGSAEAPSVFGSYPLIVETGSMADEDKDEHSDGLSFPAGCMIFVKKCDPSALKVGDVITYKEGVKEGNNVYNTHRIIGIYKVLVREGGDYNEVVVFRTKGDQTNTPDQSIVKFSKTEDGIKREILGCRIDGKLCELVEPIDEHPNHALNFQDVNDDTNHIGAASRNVVLFEDVLGQYKGSKLNAVGDFADFAQSIPGILVLVGIPVIAFLVYDILAHRKENSKKIVAANAQASAQSDELSKMRAELEALKAEKAAEGQASPKEAEAPAPPDGE